MRQFYPGAHLERRLHPDPAASRRLWRVHARTAGSHPEDRRGSDRAAAHVRLVLRDKRSFFLHSLPRPGEGSTLAIRVWDLRDLDDADFVQLKENLDRRSAQPIGSPQDLHPKLGLGILRLNIQDLAYHVEWHTRWWPPPEDVGKPSGQAPFARVEPFRRRDRQGRD